MASTTVATEAGAGRHPAGLYALFFTEMWERFSYYGMRALLVLYLVRAYGMNRPDALGIYAVYTGLVYLTPLIGGRLADMVLGQRKAVFIGGILMALGQFALTQRELLYLGLGLLVVGNGFFKPNISTMVGGLYPKGDLRKDSAYTIFYMGINLGAFLAPLICGPLGEYYNWWPGYATAGAGMALGLLTFTFTQRVLQGVGLPPGRPVEDRAVLSVRDWVEIAIWVAVCAGLVYAAITSWPSIRPFWSPRSFEGVPALAVAYKGAVMIGILGVFLVATEPRKRSTDVVDETSHKLTGEDWQRIVVIVIISLFSIVFWMGFEQSGGTLNLFAAEQTDRRVLGRTIPASILQAVNPMFIILLAPIFAQLWTYLAIRRFPLPSFAKQGLGLMLLGVGFAVMYLADQAERPTPSLAAKVDAAGQAVTGPLADVRPKPDEDASSGSETPPTAGEMMAEAAETLKEGRIPYHDLEATALALKDAGHAEASATVEAAFQEATLSRVSPLWLILTYFLFTVAELFISPIGLSLVNKLAPMKLASLMMACWFLCTAAANYLAGIMEHMIEPYHFDLWAFLGVVAFVPGVLLLLITPLLQRMSHGKA